MNQGKVLALLLTLAGAGVIGYFAWSGFKAPPVAAPASIVTTPPGWARLNGGSFTLFAPEGAQLRRGERNGLVYGDIVNAPLCLRFQAGSGVTPAVNAKTHPDFSDEVVMIDGHKATVRTAVLQQHEQQYWFGACNAPFYAGLIVPDAPGGTLVIDTTTMSDDGVEDAKTMFKSIRFAR